MIRDVPNHLHERNKTGEDHGKPGAAHKQGSPSVHAQSGAEQNNSDY